MPRNTKNNDDTNAAGSESPDEMDFQKLYYSLLERKWLIILCLACTVGLGITYITITPKTYSATTVVQVEQEESKFVKIDDISTDDLKQQEILKTIETNLTSSPLELGVIQSLKMTDAELGMKPNADGRATSDGERVEALDSMLSVKLVRGTRLINIVASHTSPMLAQRIADEVYKEYVRINAAQRAGLSGEANRFLLEESDVLKNQVKIAQEEAQAFKDAHPNTALENSQEFIDSKLLALNNKLNDAKGDLFKVESDYAQVQRLLNGANTEAEKVNQLLRIASVSSDPAVLDIRNSIADSEAGLEQVAKRYRPKHPAYIQAQAQLDGLKASLAKATIQAAEGLATAVESARQTDANFEAELKVMEKAKLDNDKVAIPYNALSAEVDANTQLYESVRMRLKETEVTRDIDTNEVRMVTPAMLPLKPSKPKKLLVILASIVGGLMIGISISHALAAVDTSFKSVDAAEAALGLPVLATIQELGRSSSGKRFLITEEPSGAVAEAFRTLRTSFSIESGATERDIILFTSAVPGEGKSFCAVNYAISLSQLAPTLLIDADLRLPTVAKTLLGKEPKLGVNTVLTGKSTLDEAIRTLPDIPNLSVLPAGGHVANPSELLAGASFGRLLNEASAKFNWIVIDTAPVHAVSDTLLLVKYSKSICFVVHAGKTPARAIQRACDLIKNAHEKPVGIVLNHVSARNHGYYYYYSSGEYGKGVYGQTADTKA